MSGQEDATKAAQRRLEAYIFGKRGLAEPPVVNKRAGFVPSLFFDNAAAPHLRPVSVLDHDEDERGEEGAVQMSAREDKFPQICHWEWRPAELDILRLSVKYELCRLIIEGFVRLKRRGRERKRRESGESNQDAERWVLCASIRPVNPSAGSAEEISFQIPVFREVQQDSPTHFDATLDRLTPRVVPRQNPKIGLQAPIEILAAADAQVDWGDWREVLRVSSSSSESLREALAELWVSKEETSVFPPIDVLLECLTECAEISSVNPLFRALSREPLESLLERVFGEQWWWEDFAFLKVGTGLFDWEMVSAVMCAYSQEALGRNAAGREFFGRTAGECAVAWHQQARPGLRGPSSAWTAGEDRQLLRVLLSGAASLALHEGVNGIMGMESRDSLCVASPESPHRWDTEMRARLPLEGDPARCTEAEVERQRLLLNPHAHDWTRVARLFGKTRSSAQCASRFISELNPLTRNAPWSREEDQQLLDSVAIYGTRSRLLVTGKGGGGRTRSVTALVCHKALPHRSEQEALRRWKFLKEARRRRLRGGGVDSGGPLCLPAVAAYQEDEAKSHQETPGDSAGIPLPLPLCDRETVTGLGGVEGVEKETEKGGGGDVTPTGSCLVGSSLCSQSVFAFRGGGGGRLVGVSTHTRSRESSRSRRSRSPSCSGWASVAPPSSASDRDEGRGRRGEYPLTIVDTPSSLSLQVPRQQQQQQEGIGEATLKPLLCPPSLPPASLCHSQAGSSCVWRAASSTAAPPAGTDTDQEERGGADSFCMSVSGPASSSGAPAMQGAEGPDNERGGREDPEMSLCLSFDAWHQRLGLDGAGDGGSDCGFSIGGDDEEEEGAEGELGGCYDFQPTDDCLLQLLVAALRDSEGGGPKGSRLIEEGMGGGKLSDGESSDESEEEGCGGGEGAMKNLTPPPIWTRVQEHFRSLGRRFDWLSLRERFRRLQPLSRRLPCTEAELRSMIRALRTHGIVPQRERERVGEGEKANEEMESGGQGGWEGICASVPSRTLPWIVRVLLFADPGGIFSSKSGLSSSSSSSSSDPTDMKTVRELVGGLCVSAEEVRSAMEAVRETEDSLIDRVRLSRLPSSCPAILFDSGILLEPRGIAHHGVDRSWRGLANNRAVVEGEGRPPGVRRLRQGEGIPMHSWQEVEMSRLVEIVCEFGVGDWKHLSREIPGHSHTELARAVRWSDPGQLISKHLREIRSGEAKNPHPLVTLLKRVQLSGAAVRSAMEAASETQADLVARLVQKLQAPLTKRRERIKGIESGGPQRAAAKKAEKPAGERKGKKTKKVVKVGRGRRRTTSDGKTAPLPSVSIGLVPGCVPLTHQKTQQKKRRRGVEPQPSKVRAPSETSRKQKRVRGREAAAPSVSLPATDSGGEDSDVPLSQALLGHQRNKSRGSKVSKAKGKTLNQTRGGTVTPKSVTGKAVKAKQNGRPKSSAAPLSLSAPSPQMYNATVTSEESPTPSVAPQPVAQPTSFLPPPPAPCTVTEIDDDPPPPEGVRRSGRQRREKKPFSPDDLPSVPIKQEENPPADARAGPPAAQRAKPRVQPPKQTLKNTRTQQSSKQRPARQTQKTSERRSHIHTEAETDRSNNFAFPFVLPSAGPVHSSMPPVAPLPVPSVRIGTLPPNRNPTLIDDDDDDDEPPPPPFVGGDQAGVPYIAALPGSRFLARSHPS
uniref:Myb-like domain-containing protein n=1 Tax=Chromera velia CCMP2878 TaxID=1169474 RepID=A0A0G4GLB8_9ALVE|eukprot:Cvel_690.t1-p1 / transcript=Cvel_690.t1 / gene=Cvel_690 / organism=Chromera_velia_CCMP2878 / gene_product=hypothetical protein / transcript_product=hypothetical protein / location=Cvel_scaffold21:113236-118491(-) / protein_length=1674 / sequence_SO=supercontig / SO=protein_coding / is_pseudo=false